MLYVLTSANGALLGWATDPERLPAAPSGSVVVTRESWDAPPPRPYVWDVVERDWVVPVPVVARPRPLSQLEFASRFTEAEQMALEMAEESSPDANVRAALRVVSNNLARAESIYVDDPRTVRGVEIVVGVLVAMGVVAALDVETRTAALLAPP